MELKNRLTILQMKKVFKMRLSHRFFSISQHFGQNLVDYSQFGLKGHNGIDTTFDGGEKIQYVCDGKVFFTQTNAENPGYGNTVWQLSDFFTVDGVEFYMKITYGHLANFVSVINQKVKKGDFLGIGDSTGYSTGNHMHITLKPMFKQSNGVFMSEDDNGYKGAIDPFPFIEEIVPSAFYRKWIALDSTNSILKSEDEGVLPVDVRYWRYWDENNTGKRPWHTYLSEKRVLWQLGRKGLKADKDFTSRELRALVYGGWSFDDVFGSNGIAQTKTWKYRKKYN